MPICAPLFDQSARGTKRVESIKLVAKQKEFSEERAGEERCSLREFFCDPLGSLPASQKRVHTSHCGTLSLKTREERKDAREWVSVSLTHSNTYFVCTQQSHTPYTEFGRGLSIGQSIGGNRLRWNRGRKPAPSPEDELHMAVFHTSSTNTREHVHIT